MESGHLDCCVDLGVCVYPCSLSSDLDFPIVPVGEWSSDVCCWACRQRIDDGEPHPNNGSQCVYVD